MPAIRRKLSKNGNAPTVAIPRPVMHFLGWHIGEEVMLEVTDRQTLEIRRPALRDFVPADVVPFLPAPGVTDKR